MIHQKSHAAHEAVEVHIRLFKKILYAGLSVFLSLRTLRVNLNQGHNFVVSLLSFIIAINVWYSVGSGLVEQLDCKYGLLWTEGITVGCVLFDKHGEQRFSIAERHKLQHENKKLEFSILQSLRKSFIIGISSLYSTVIN